ncbi:hypothetical protein EDD15DRAFT_2200074 [Pisolithus albus]|nr:hypothetical protein EDD15DRAFT_2200074 [Pisolithus albus]
MTGRKMLSGLSLNADMQRWAAQHKVLKNLESWHVFLNAYELQDFYSSGHKSLEDSYIHIPMTAVDRWYNRYTTKAMMLQVMFIPMSSAWVTRELIDMVEYGQLFDRLVQASQDVFLWIGSVLQMHLPEAEYSALVHVAESLPGNVVSHVEPFISVVVNVNTQTADAHWFGRESTYDALVLDLLGPSLHDLLLQYQTFSLSTVVALGDQLVSCPQPLPYVALRMPHGVLMVGSQRVYK